MDRADVEKIVVRAGIPEIVAESTSHLTGSLLDIVRRQLVALDEIVGRVIYRLTGRDPTERPVAPALLRGAEGLPGVSTKGRAQVTGHYAGAITRLAAFAVDGFAVFGLFTLAAAAVAFVATLFGLEFDASTVPGVVSAVIYTGWAFIYWWVGLALLGKTLGKGLVGLRVVSYDGRPLTARRALVRTLSLPISFLLFGLGLLGIVLGRHRRALHDVIAGTCEVYDWGDRPADIPAPLTRWIERRVDAR
ncbi:MAG: RDD family protein, partial [Acidimicrobiia bacterium]